MLLGDGMVSALLGKQRCRTCLSSPGKSPQHWTSWVVFETLVKPSSVKDHPAQEGLRITTPFLRLCCCIKCKAVQIQ